MLRHLRTRLHGADEVTMTMTMTHSNEVSNNLSTLPYGLEWEGERRRRGEEGKGVMTPEQKNVLELSNPAQRQFV